MQSENVILGEGINPYVSFTILQKFTQVLFNTSKKNFFKNDKTGNIYAIFTVQTIKETIGYIAHLISNARPNEKMKKSSRGSFKKGNKIQKVLAKLQNYFFILLSNLGRR